MLRLLASGVIRVKLEFVFLQVCLQGGILRGTGTSLRIPVSSTTPWQQASQKADLLRRAPPRLLSSACLPPPPPSIHPLPPARLLHPLNVHLLTPAHLLHPLSVPPLTPVHRFHLHRVHLLTPAPPILLPSIRHLKPALRNPPSASPRSFLSQNLSTRATVVLTSHSQPPQSSRSFKVTSREPR